MTATLDMTTLDASDVDLIDTERQLCASFRAYVEIAWSHVCPSELFIPNWHIDLICSNLEASARGETKDLLINVPPGTMKSLLTCVFWPTWVWGPHGWPQSSWFFASYSDDLTIRDSLRRRNLMRSSWYQDLWGDQVQFTNDQNLKSRFRSESGGEMIATSVGGAGLGEHPDFLVIDDPHKTKEAESEQERANVAFWWSSTISTRGVIKGSRRVIIMQRLNAQDLSGHVIPSGEFKHLCLPMRFEPDHPNRCPQDPRTEPGELLWPAAFPKEKVDKVEASMLSVGGPAIVAGQMQQRPNPAGGGQFRREYFRYAKDDGDHYTLIKTGRKIAKSNCWRFCVIDTAMSTRKAADYTVRGVIDVERIVTLDKRPAFGVAILVDVWRARVPAPAVEAQVRTDLDRWRPLFFALEAISDGGALYQRLEMEGLPIKRMKYAHAGKETHQIPDKVTKAVAAEVAYSNERIYHLDGAPWLDAFENELLLFPNDAHDDQPDMISQAAHVIQGKDYWAEAETVKVKPGTLGAIAGHDELTEVPAGPVRRMQAHGYKPTDLRELAAQMRHQSTSGGGAGGRRDPFRRR